MVFKIEYFIKRNSLKI